jgi:hypothetical protein
MKSRLLVSILVFSAVSVVARADGVADFARAQLMFAQVMNGIQQYKQVAATTHATPPEPVAPAPLTDKSGKFFLPYDSNGQLVEWANKALAANVGAAVGSKAGEKAGAMAASKIPLAGGLLAMGAKKKGKELGAMAAVGGAKFVKESSSLSFNSLEDMALYMHLNFSANTDYVKGLAAAIAIYPDLYKTYEKTMKKAYAAR